MVPLKNAVHIGGGEFVKVHPMGANGPIADIEEVIAPSAAAMLDELAWWTDVTRSGRSD